MQRLKAIHPKEASGKTKEIFDHFEKSLGQVPNMIQIMANAPAVLEAYINFSTALSKGKLSARVTKLISLAVSEANDCNYCLSLHTFIGEKMMGIDISNILDSRNGFSSDQRVLAILQFAKRLTSKRGQVEAAEIEMLKNAGFEDGEISEIIANVVLNIFTNYFNLATGTEPDFPSVGALKPHSGI